MGLHAVLHERHTKSSHLLHLCLVALFGPAAQEDDDGEGRQGNRDEAEGDAGDDELLARCACLVAYDGVFLLQERGVLLVARADFDDVVGRLLALERVVVVVASFCIR